MSLVDFTELAPGQTFRVDTEDRGALSAIAVTSPNAQAQAQALFVIDPANPLANDNNPGTALLPLVTVAAWASRVGGVINANMTLQWNSAPLATDFLTGRFSVGQDQGLTLTSATTVFKSGTLTANTTAINRAAGTDSPEIIQDTGLAGGFTTSVGKFLVIGGGSGRAGSYCRVLADLGGGNAQVSPFVQFVDIDTAPALAALPQTGDPYTIVDVIKVNIGDFEVVPASNASMLAPKKNVLFIDTIELVGGATGFVGFPTVQLTHRISLYAKMAIFTNMTIFSTAGLQVGLGCGWREQVRLIGQDPLNFNNYFPGWFACSQTSGALEIGAPGQVALGMDTVFKNAALLIDNQATVLGSRVSFFGGTGLTVSINGNYVSTNLFGIDGGADLLYGTGVTGFAMKIRSVSALVYKTKPTVNSTLGAGRFASVGGTDKQSAAIPFIEPANNAAFVVLA